MPTILICEDEDEIISFLQAELQSEGFGTDTATDGIQAMALFNAAAYDLVLLDIMLPHKNGLECLREIRKTSAVPVIILTARRDIFDKVAFLNAGADDYVTKPFDTLELVARIKRNLARSTANTAGLTMDRDAYRAAVNGRELPLTKTEFEILHYLYENKNKVKTRNEIIQAVFGDFYGESNIIDVNIRNIRVKIQDFTEDEIIGTVRGKGYVVRL
jgi:two-component system response regulator ArlR